MPYALLYCAPRHSTRHDSRSRPPLANTRDWRAATTHIADLAGPAGWELSGGAAPAGPCRGPAGRAMNRQGSGRRAPPRLLLGLLLLAKFLLLASADDAAAAWEEKP